MDWQQLVSLMIVAAAALLLLAGKLCRRKFGFERQMQCSCANLSHAAPFQGSIIFRARKGQRCEVVVKMR
jgi:hypothetical protein